MKRIFVITLLFAIIINGTLFISCSEKNSTMASSNEITKIDGFEQSIEKARLFNRYGLNNEAKSELINLIYSNTNENNKIDAIYFLGNIAFDENKIALALDTWKDLNEKYPNNKYESSIEERFKELSQIVIETTDNTISNAVALTYLRNGDFCSKDKRTTFMIDGSWIPNVESAIKWYDKVINEFPKTEASRIAYQSKLRTILGWEETGRYGDKYGIKESFSKYIPQLLETFSAFESDHPDDSTLQAFRYQIAQAYWVNKNWAKTREWLNIILEKSGEADSFYKDLAQRRLQKVEW